MEMRMRVKVYRRKARSIGGTRWGKIIQGRRLLNFIH
jgi:hypothetical protein